MAKPNENRALLLLAVVILLWGVNWPVMKVGLNYIGPVWFALARVVLGCACLFCVLLFLGRLRLPARRDLPVLISVGVFQVAVITGLIHFALQFTEAGRSAFLAYTTPLWAAPLAAIFLGERLTQRKALGLALGLTGIAILFEPGSFDITDTGAVIGSGMLILVAIISASVIVHMRGKGGSVTVLELVPWQMLLGALLLLPVALLLDGPPRFIWSPALVAVLVYNGPIASAFGFWAYVMVMRDLPATTTAMGSLGTPVVGMLSSAIFLAEPLPPTKVLGVALIVAGVLGVTVANLRRT